jgi:hypothetical protein
MVLSNRGFKFGEHGNLALHKLLWEVFEIDPNLWLGQYTELVRELGVTDITKWKIGEIFRSWGWSWKVPAQKQLKKYTPENIIYYLNWIKCVLHLDWLKASFLMRVILLTKISTLAKWLDHKVDLHTEFAPED